jgi:serine protease Do
MGRKSIASVCLAAGLLTGTVGGSYLLGQHKTVPAYPKEVTTYRDVVKQVLPAVVSIETRVKPVTHKTKSGARPDGSQKFFKQFTLPNFDNKQLPDEMRKFFEDFQQQPFSGPESTPHHGFGSGFLVDPKGVILTNNHVVAGADEVEVTLRDGRKFTSKDIKTDPKTDLAIVRIEAKEALPHLDLGDSDAMEIGDRVLAVGAPFGMTGTVTSGIVSAKGRSLHLNVYEDFLQTDAAINPGNSGGPLVNLEGKVIGINAAIKSRSGGFQGVGLAIPSNMVRSVYQQLVKDGVVHRGYLGVQIKDLDAAVASHLGLDNQKGVLVAKVFDGSPADKAGLQGGDVIMALDGKAVENGRDLQRVVAGLPLNKPVSLSVLRDGAKKELKVTVAEQPSEFGLAGNVTPSKPKAEKNADRVEKAGVELADVTPQLAEQYGYKENVTGVFVTEVTPNSPAAEAGLRPGMLLAKVDKKPVSSTAEARKALDKAALDRGVLLQVQSPEGGTDFVLLKVAGETASAK